MPAGLVEKDAEVLQSDDVIGVCSQYTPIDSFGVRQLPGLVVREGSNQKRFRFLMGVIQGDTRLILDMPVPRHRKHLAIAAPCLPSTR